MKRWLPSPWLSLGLLAGWLLLNRSFGAAAWLLGAVLAVLLPLLTAPLRPTPGSLHHFGVLLRLIVRVGHHVVRSALQVGAGVLRVQSRPPKGAFVVVPLQLRDAHGLAALAMITTVIPGTVWSELAADRSALLIHVFDLDDEATFIATFKADYEQPLREIFE